MWLELLQLPYFHKISIMGKLWKFWERKTISIISSYIGLNYCLFPLFSGGILIFVFSHHVHVYVNNTASYNHISEFIVAFLFWNLNKRVFWNFNIIFLFYYYVSIFVSIKMVWYSIIKNTLLEQELALGLGQVKSVHMSMWWNISTIQ